MDRGRDRAPIKHEQGVAPPHWVKSHDTTTSLNPDEDYPFPLQDRSAVPQFSKVQISSQISSSNTFSIRKTLHIIRATLRTCIIRHISMVH